MDLFYAPPDCLMPSFIQLCPPHVRIQMGIFQFRPRNFRNEVIQSTTSQSLNIPFLSLPKSPLVSQRWQFLLYPQLIEGSHARIAQPHETLNLSQVQ